MSRRQQQQQQQQHNPSSAFDNNQENEGFVDKVKLSGYFWCVNAASKLYLMRSLRKSPFWLQNSVHYPELHRHMCDFIALSDDQAPTSDAEADNNNNNDNNDTHMNGKKRCRMVIQSLTGAGYNLDENDMAAVMTLAASETNAHSLASSSDITPPLSKSASPSPLRHPQTPSDQFTHDSVRQMMASMAPVKSLFASFTSDLEMEVASTLVDMKWAVSWS